jgi:hypothetical protein
MASTGVDRINGIDPAVANKAPCKVATTGNITLSGAQTIDGIAVSETTPKTRVLVKSQTDSTENGIYEVMDTLWVRSKDCNDSRDVVDGTYVLIQSGTTYTNKIFSFNFTGTLSFGTTEITFELINQDLEVDGTRFLSVGLSQIGTLDLSNWEYAVFPGIDGGRIEKNNAATWTSATAGYGGVYFIDSVGNKFERPYIGFVNVAWFGATDGADISTPLQDALDYVESLQTFGKVRGMVVIPSGWSVTVSQQITIAAGCGVSFWGATITQTTTGVITFYTNSAFAPVGVRIDGSALYGPDTTAVARLGSGSYGIKIEGGLPFAQVNIDELKNFEWGGYTKNSYSSRIRFGRIYSNRVNWQFQDECHSSEIDCEFSELADDDALRINDSTSTNFVHNITIKGAYQKSKWGVIALKCYEVWGENLYHEGNTKADVQFGAADAGVYALAAYNCGVRTWQSASATGTAASEGNIVLKHAVGASFPCVSILSGATGNNINYDGFCGDIQVGVKVGPEPTIYKDGGGATDDKLQLTYKGDKRISGEAQLTWKYDATRIGKRYAAAGISSRPTLFDVFLGTSADYINDVQDRQIFRDSAGVQGLVIDHLNNRLDCGYQARPATDNAVSMGSATNRWTEVFAVAGVINTSDVREKTPIEGMDEAERRVALKAKSLMGKFKWNESIEKKGDAARIHFGIGAQTLAQCFTDEGLNPHAYGMFCYDEWGDEFITVPAVLDENGNEVESERQEQTQKAGNRYGVRYDQLLAFILSAI